MIYDFQIDCSIKWYFDFLFSSLHTLWCVSVYVERVKFNASFKLQKHIATGKGMIFICCINHFYILYFFEHSKHKKYIYIYCWSVKNARFIQSNPVICRLNTNYMFYTDLPLWIIFFFVWKSSFHINSDLIFRCRNHLDFRKLGFIRKYLVLILCHIWVEWENHDPQDM